MLNKEWHRCSDYDYVDMGNKEFLLFCPTCKKALGVVTINIKDNIKQKHKFDSKTIEELR